MSDRAFNIAFGVFAIALVVFVHIEPPETAAVVQARHDLKVTTEEFCGPGAPQLPETQVVCVMLSAAADSL